LWFKILKCLEFKFWIRTLWLGDNSSKSNVVLPPDSFCFSLRARTSCFIACISILSQTKDNFIGRKIRSGRVSEHPRSLLGGTSLCSSQMLQQSFSWLLQLRTQTCWLSLLTWTEAQCRKIGNHFLKSYIFIINLKIPPELYFYVVQVSLMKKSLLFHFLIFSLIDLFCSLGCLF